MMNIKTLMMEATKDSKRVSPMDVTMYGDACILRWFRVGIFVEIKNRSLRFRC